MLGHEPIVSRYVESMVGKTDQEKEALKIQQKNDQDAMRRDIENLEQAEAILMLNLDKNGISNYIGGNAFLELGWAYLQKKKLFFYNPIPDIPVFKTELVAMRPIILHGRLQDI